MVQIVILFDKESLLAISIHTVSLSTVIVTRGINQRCSSGLWSRSDVALVTQLIHTVVGGTMKMAAG